MITIEWDELHEIRPDKRAEIEAYLAKLPAGTDAARHISTLLASLDDYKAQYERERQSALEWLYLELPPEYAPFKTVSELLFKLTYDGGAYA